MARPKLESLLQRYVFAAASAGPFKVLGMKTKDKDEKEVIDDSMSDRIPNSSTYLWFEEMAWTNPLQSERKIILLMLRDIACRRAPRIASASAIDGEETNSWYREPLAMSLDSWSVKIQAIPADFVCESQAASVLQVDHIGCVGLSFNWGKFQADTRDVIAREVSSQHTRCDRLESQSTYIFYHFTWFAQGPNFPCEATFKEEMGEGFHLVARGYI